LSALSADPNTHEKGEQKHKRKMRSKKDDLTNLMHCNDFRDTIAAWPCFSAASTATHRRCHIMLLQAGLGAALLALVLHVGYMVNKFGLYTSWQKSVARKNSYTSGVYHLWAVYKLRSAQAEPDPVSEAEADRMSRNLHAWFWRKTGEVATPEAKVKKFEAMVAARRKNAAARSPSPAGRPRRQVSQSPAK
jgi:hypothetical protein